MEKANHTAAQRWWRSLPDEVTAAAAQASLDEFCATIADHRRRTDAAGNRCTVADLAAAEPLRSVPEDPPVAVTTVTRKASAQGLVSFRGNTYSVPPAHAGQQMTVTHRLGAAVLTITTGNRVTVAVHPRRPDGAGLCVRTDVHITALNTGALMSESGARSPNDGSSQAVHLEDRDMVDFILRMGCR